MPKATPKKRGRPSKAQTTAEAATTKKPRGRPPTKKATTGGDVSVPAPAKRRGRPPKAASSSGATQAKSRVAKPAPKGKTKPATIPNKAQATAVGGYAITCKAITEGWDHIDKDDLALDISESSTPGVYEASFDFGVLTGVMVLSADEKLLEAHVDELEEEEEEYDSDDDDDDSEVPAPAKKAAKAPAPSGLTYHLEWRGSDTSTGQKYSGPYTGEIKFTSKTFKKFSGIVDLVFVGGSVEIKGERVTDKANGDASEWNDYGDQRYRSDRGYAHWKNSNNWGYDRWGKWGFLG